MSSAAKKSRHRRALPLNHHFPRSTEGTQPDWSKAWQGLGELEGDKLARHQGAFQWLGHGHVESWCVVFFSWPAAWSTEPFRSTTRLSDLVGVGIWSRLQNQRLALNARSARCRVCNLDWSSVCHSPAGNCEGSRTSSRLFSKL